ncbi:hypothetical protein [Neolewinella persica]|uniref:hypothetical protein n=1 Tax=Neolewinella persica TaxID=70998 RepID=UPI0003699E6C|nr:hypothetical protein [Neolewinella persica]
MKYILTFVLLVCANSTGFACKCVDRSFEKEVELAEIIIVAKVIERKGNIYDLLIKQEWSSRISLRTSDTIRITQGLNSCTRRTFEKANTYLFYLENYAVHNCSRTISFANARDIDLLNDRFNSVYYNHEPSYDSLNYKRRFIIETFNGKVYDTNGKSVVYVMGNSIISKEQIPLDHDLFYPLRYYLVEQTTIPGIDYIFYLEKSHQERNGAPEIRKSLLRKIRAFKKKL